MTLLSGWRCSWAPSASSAYSAYVVAQRTREIGVRMALGAEAREVRTMIVAQGARVVGLGAAVGILASLASTSRETRRAPRVDPPAASPSLSPGRPAPVAGPRPGSPR